MLDPVLDKKRAQSPQKLYGNKGVRSINGQVNILVNPESDMFSSPIRGNVSMQRPSTAFRKTKSKIDTNIDKGKDKKVGKKQASSLSSLVRKKDRIKSADLINYLNLFLQTASKI